MTIDRLTAALADRYRLERELGAGGMATVYLAHDLKHDRQVAIKVLRPELAAVIGAERFLAEIKTTANLQHPHILPLFDSGVAYVGHSERSEESGRIGSEFLYYVMPYIEGETLRKRLERERQLPLDDAVRIAAETASALEYAHKRGIVHRDIKPENILLHDGHPLVADFGIALAVQQAGGSRLTQTGMSLGTPHYMAPEQAMGERAVDARADVYALGAVTYEMLAGEPPFTGPTAQAIVARVMTDRPRPLGEVRDTVSPALEAAVHRALQKLPADRWQGAGEFATALQSALTLPHATDMRTAAMPAAGRTRGRTAGAARRPRRARGPRGIPRRTRHASRGRRRAAAVLARHPRAQRRWLRRRRAQPADRHLRRRLHHRLRLRRRRRREPAAQSAARRTGSHRDRRLHQPLQSPVLAGRPFPPGLRSRGGAA